MPRFEFALEGVLRQREHAEQECQRRLAVQQEQVTAAENELRALDQTRQASLNDIRQNRLVGRVDMAFLAAYRRYSASVQRKGNAIAQRMALAQSKVDVARQALVEAAKQRKIVEKLRERQLERWKQENARKEAAELDEVTTRLTGWRAARHAAEDMDGDGSSDSSAQSASQDFSSAADNEAAASESGP